MVRTKKKLSQKSNLKESKDGCQKGGRRFSEPSASSFDNPMSQRRAREGGDVFPRTKFVRIASYGNNLSTEGHDQQSTDAQKAQSPQPKK